MFDERSPIRLRAGLAEFPEDGFTAEKLLEAARDRWQNNPVRGEEGPEQLVPDPFSGHLRQPGGETADPAAGLGSETEAELGRQSDSPQTPEGIVGEDSRCGRPETTPGEISEPPERIDDLVGRIQGRGQSVHREVPVLEVRFQGRAPEVGDVDDSPVVRENHPGASPLLVQGHEPRLQSPGELRAQGQGTLRNRQVDVLHLPAQELVPYRSADEPDAPGVQKVGAEASHEGRELQGRHGRRIAGAIL